MTPSCVRQSTPCAARRRRLRQTSTAANAYSPTPACAVSFPPARRHPQPRCSSLEMPVRSPGPAAPPAPLAALELTPPPPPPVPLIATQTPPSQLPFEHMVPSAL